MFQCYSPKSPHPLLPPLRPEVCSLSVSPLLPRTWDRQYHLSRPRLCVLIYICLSLSALLHSV